ncbi:MAG: phosphodiester glycosidase family protein [Muribaculaceae bacterium]|nr:phosphodiester glycosidase family protein [Muribaculaceae bacterium]
MKKIILSLAAAALLAPAMQAEKTVWTLAGADYTVDTLACYKSGPGTTLAELKLTNSARTMKLWVTTTDLTDPNVEIKTINGTPIRSKSMIINKMVDSRKGDGNVYFLGVNADLFSTLGPIGTNICDGEILKTAKKSTGWSAVGVNKDGQLNYGTPLVQFSAKLNGKTELAPTLVNVPRGTGETVLFTNRWSSTTTFWPITGDPESPEGIHVVLKPKDGILHSDRPTECTVQSAPVQGSKTVSVPAGCFVLSSNVAKNITRYANFKVGDTYTITPASINISSSAYGDNHSLAGTMELCGGDPMLIVQGERKASYPTMPDYGVRRPRTAIGSDKSGTKMYLAVLDGDAINKGVSAGADANEWADVMLAIGSWYALNFDGGGSTVMYTDCFGIMNVPSGTGDTWGSIKMRPVRNGWFVATPDLGDTEMASIEFVDPHLTCDKGYTYTPKFYGYNKAGLLVNKNVTGVILAAPRELGTVSADGKTLTVTGDGTYALTAIRGGMECTIAVRAGDYTANASGIEDVVVDTEEAPAEYYTLQGIRVPADRLASGIYIKKQGAKAEKIKL